MSASEAPRAPAAPIRLLVVGEEHLRAKVARHYRRLAASGVSATFYLDDRSGITRAGGEVDGVEVLSAPDPSASRGAVLRYWRRFASVLSARRPDVVEAYTSIHPAVILPMVLLARARGLPVVVVCRGELHPSVFGRASRSWRAALTALLRVATLVIYKERYMEAVLGRLAPRTPRFGWTNAVPPGPEPSLERDEDAVLFLNFFQRTRNLDLIVRAARRVVDEVPSATFHLVGGTRELASTSGFYADLNRYEEEIRALIERLGLARSVHVHPFTSDVLPWFQRARVYLLPADHVYCNYALLESMASGVPPIVSADVDPDARLIVDDGVNGRVVPREPAALADAILGLLRDETRRRALGAAARRTVVERFNLDRTCLELVEQYARLAGREGAGGPGALRGAA